MYLPVAVALPSSRISTTEYLLFLMLSIKSDKLTSLESICELKRFITTDERMNIPISKERVLKLKPIQLFFTFGILFIFDF